MFYVSCSMQKQVIILFGQPGAGKGTQAEILSDKTGYYHFESSKVIEACFENENPEKVFSSIRKIFQAIRFHL